jgi:hypothetical protein
VTDAQRKRKADRGRAKRPGGGGAAAFFDASLERKEGALRQHATAVPGKRTGPLVLTDPERFSPERHGGMAATLLAAISRGPRGAGGDGGS